MKLPLKKRIEITRHLIRTNINKTYAELAEDCTKIFELKEAMPAHQARTFLNWAKNIGDAKSKLLTLESRCEEAKKLSTRLEELVPTRQRGRRRVH
ncbi:MULTISPECIES: hypothetical protein [unclassified Thiocapsa]|uniref:hypothetical protein n=1 Tax=unclassified Thiocapsa TaxID=2641286 RepID=UPI0035B3058E